MTQYTARISYTCPVADIDAANAFLAWVGESLGDAETFRAPEAGDYALASGAYTPAFLSRLGTPVTEDNRPEWGESLDLALAQAGQAALLFEIDESDPDAAALASKGKAGKVTTSIKGVASGASEGAPAWASGMALSVGDFVVHSGTTYMCIQAHQTQADWTPDVVPALFLVIPSDAAVWTAGAAYTIGDVVEYQGAQYECRQSHVAQVGWEPPNVLALWLPL